MAQLMMIEQLWVMHNLCTNTTCVREGLNSHGKALEKTSETWFPLNPDHHFTEDLFH